MVESFQQGIRLFGSARQLKDEAISWIWYFIHAAGSATTVNALDLLAHLLDDLDVHDLTEHRDLPGLLYRIRRFTVIDGQYQALVILSFFEGEGLAPNHRPDLVIDKIGFLSACRKTCKVCLDQWRDLGISETAHNIEMHACEVRQTLFVDG